MRRSFLTFGLGLSALAAALLAPRLRAMVVEPTPQTPPVSAVHSEPVAPEQLVESTLEQVAPPPPRMPVIPLPPQREQWIPMKTGQAPTELIPELDAPQQVVVQPPPPPPQPPIELWDNCPACGMG